MKLCNRLIFITLIAISLITQGCASTNMSLSKSNFESIKSVYVARTATPKLEVKTLTGAILFGGGVLDPLVTDLSSKEARRFDFPDISELLLKNFASQAKNEISTWSDLHVVATPVAEGYNINDGNLLIFNVTEFRLHMRGLGIGANVQMFDKDKNTIFKHRIWYGTFQYGDYKSQDEYLADNGKLLIEEMNIAAGRIGKEIVAQLKTTGR